MLRAAYDTFLRVRLTAAWQSETVPRLRVWLARSILEKKQLEFELATAAKSAASRRLSRPQPRPRAGDVVERLWPLYRWRRRPQGARRA